ncbi:MAG: UpxY family transcription antiterminator [Muribaculaceae bacterium]
MNVSEHASDDVNCNGGISEPPYTGGASGVLPEIQQPLDAENSHTGVSTRCVQSRTRKASKNKLNNLPHWYALRTTYGREKKAYDYLISKNATAFLPTLSVTKMINGKKVVVKVSRIPNMFFAYGTEDEIKAFVYDNINLPYLRFYYRYHRMGNRVYKEPLIVPDYQVDSLKIICESEGSDIIVVPDNVDKFKVGQPVRIIDGNFKGVVGKVARYHGQQRVAVIIEGLLTMATAYIPKAFLEMHTEI